MHQLLKHNFETNIHDPLLQRVSKDDDSVDLSNPTAKIVTPLLAEFARFTLFSGCLLYLSVHAP